MATEKVTITSDDVGTMEALLKPARWNLHDEDGKYVTTVLAGSPQEALAEGKESHPKLKLILGAPRRPTKGTVSFGAAVKPGAKVNKKPKVNQDGVRHNLHTKDGEYVTTVYANSPEEAIAKAKKDHPEIKAELTGPPPKKITKITADQLRAWRQGQVDEALYHLRGSGEYSAEEIKKLEKDLLAAMEKQLLEDAKSVS